MLLIKWGYCLSSYFHVLQHPNLNGIQKVVLLDLPSSPRMVWLSLTPPRFRQEFFLSEEVQMEQ